MRTPAAWVLALGLALPGCYHVTVDTGRPAETREIYEAWASAYLWGLIPPKVVTTAVTCQGSVSRVETRHSFLNVLAGVGTLGIYTPVEVRVVCAAGR
jgi:Bor protein